MLSMMMKEYILYTNKNHRYCSIATMITKPSVEYSARLRFLKEHGLELMDFGPNPPVALYRPDPKCNCAHTFQPHSNVVIY